MNSSRCLWRHNTTFNVSDSSASRSFVWIFVPHLKLCSSIQLPITSKQAHHNDSITVKVNDFSFIYFISSRANPYQTRGFIVCLCSGGEINSRMTFAWRSHDGCMNVAEHTEGNMYLNPVPISATPHPRPPPPNEGCEFRFFPIFGHLNWLRTSWIKRH